VSLVRPLDVLDGRYQVYLDHRAADAVIGHVHHVDRKGKHGFGAVQTPVGHVVAHVHPGGAEVRRHWEVHVLLRAGIRYDESTDTTTIVEDARTIAGPDETLLLELAVLRTSSLPPCHPDFPRELARVLLAAGLCAEPMFIMVDHYMTESSLEFGKLLDNEDEG